MINQIEVQTQAALPFEEAYKLVETLQQADMLNLAFEPAHEWSILSEIAVEELVTRLHSHLARKGYHFLLETVRFHNRQDPNALWDIADPQDFLAALKLALERQQVLNQADRGALNTKELLISLPGEKLSTFARELQQQMQVVYHALARSRNGNGRFFSPRALWTRLQSRARRAQAEGHLKRTLSQAAQYTAHMVGSEVEREAVLTRVDRLPAGFTWSFNETFQQGAGYKEAGGILAGGHCALATVFQAAATQAGLPVESRPQATPIPGFQLDQTVNICWGRDDLLVHNNTGLDLIFVWTVSPERVEVRLTEVTQEMALLPLPPVENITVAMVYGRADPGGWGSLGLTTIADQALNLAQGYAERVDQWNGDKKTIVAVNPNATMAGQVTKREAYLHYLIAEARRQSKGYSSPGIFGLYVFKADQVANPDKIRRYDAGGLVVPILDGFGGSGADPGQGKIEKTRRVLALFGEGPYGIMEFETHWGNRYDQIRAREYFAAFSDALILVSQ